MGAGSAPTMIVLLRLYPCRSVNDPEQRNGGFAKRTLRMIRSFDIDSTVATGTGVASRSAYLENGIIQLIFSIGIVFFSHENSARTVFSASFSHNSASRMGPLIMVNRERLNLKKGSLKYATVSVVAFPGISNLAKLQLQSLVFFLS